MLRSLYDTEESEGQNETITDEKRATQMSHGDDLSRQVRVFGSLEDSYSKVLTDALKKIHEVECEYAKRKESEDSTNEDDEIYHHVINKGVNNLYKDIIKAFFERFAHRIKRSTERIDYKLLSEMVIIKRDGLPRGFLGHYDIPREIKGIIYEMKLKKPVGKRYKNKNALEFGCAKIALLACVNCVMLDIYENVTKNKMPERFCAKLKNLRRIITNCLIKKNGEHGVYVDSEAKQWWDEEHPRDVLDFGDFKRCERSVKFFLENIASNRELVTVWGHWVYGIIKMLRGGVQAHPCKCSF